MHLFFSAIDSFFSTTSRALESNAVRFLEGPRRDHSENDSFGIGIPLSSNKCRQNMSAEKRPHSPPARNLKCCLPGTIYGNVGVNKHFLVWALDTVANPIHTRCRQQPPNFGSPNGALHRSMSPEGVFYAYIAQEGGSGHLCSVAVMYIYMVYIHVHVFMRSIERRTTNRVKVDVCPGTFIGIQRTWADAHAHNNINVEAHVTAYFRMA